MFNQIEFLNYKSFNCKHKNQGFFPGVNHYQESAALLLLKIMNHCEYTKYLMNRFSKNEKMNENFERQLDRLMGESKAILSPPDLPEINKSNEIVTQICKYRL